MIVLFPAALDIRQEAVTRTMARPPPNCQASPVAAAPHKPIY